MTSLEEKNPPYQPRQKVNKEHGADTYQYKDFQIHQQVRIKAWPCQYGAQNGDQAL